jgi:probable HAF family extracellular repeat protein
MGTFIRSAIEIDNHRGCAMKIATCVFVLLFVLGTEAASAAGPAKYTYMVVDYPEAPNTGVFGINESGQLSGTFFDLKGIAHAFTYKAGKYAAIDYPKAERTFGFGIDATGRVVGYYIKDGSTHGFLYDAGKFTDVDYPKAASSRAYGINASGQIVGSYQDTRDGNPHGFLLSAGKYTAINFPGAVRTEAFGINDAGQIVGDFSDSTSAVHGFLDKTGVMTKVDFPKSFHTNLYGISKTGKVCGTVADTSRNHGFIDDSGYTKLNFPGALSTFGFALNDSGQVVGQYVDEDSVDHGFVAMVGEKQAPQISKRLGPDSTAAGLGEFKLQVRGAAFVPGAVLQWNGEPRPTTFVDDTLLTATILASDTVTPGTALLRVINPGPEALASNVQTFIVTPHDAK